VPPPAMLLMSQGWKGERMAARLCSALSRARGDTTGGAAPELSPTLGACRAGSTSRK
jgi:hypothetical protein